MRRSRVSPRRARHFSLLRQRKVPKRKATLLSVSPALRFGATCDARARGVPRNSLRACGASFGQTRQVSSRRRASYGARPPRALRFSARPKGSSGRVRDRMREPGTRGRAQRWPVSGPHPLGLRLRRGVCGGRRRASARMLRHHACRGCLNGAPKGRAVSSAAPAANAPTQVALSASEGSQTVGSPFPGLLSFGEAKESECAAGRTSRLPPHARLGATQKPKTPHQRSEGGEPSLRYATRAPAP